MSVGQADNRGRVYKGGTKNVRSTDLSKIGAGPTLN